MNECRVGPTRARIAILLLSCATACASASAPLASLPEAGAASALAYVWEEVARPGTGAFPDEWSGGRWPMTLLPIEAFGGRLYMTAQRAVFTSDDALTWARAGKADWGERISEATAFFAGKLWMSGGLRYADNVFLNDLWSSSDGARWQQAGNGEWSPRKGHTLVVFEDALWLLGGAIEVDADRVSTAFVNDVWRSEDGLRFARVTESAPWSPREYPRVLVFRGQLWLIGGQGHADVWTSRDGIAWTEVLAEAPWGARWDFGALVFDDKLWVLGGREEVSTNAHQDVWSSSDGRTWLKQAERAPWTARSGVHSIVYRDRVFLFSGKHTGAPDNWGGDIWTMRRAD